MVILASVAVTTMLTASAAPAVSIRIPVSATDLVEVSEVGPPVLSPDGARAAYRVARPSVEFNAIRIDWYVADVDGKGVVHVGSGGAAQFAGSGVLAEQQPVWDPDSRGLRFLARVDGVVGIWRWREGRGLALEISGDADVLDFILSNDGKAIRYTVGAARSEVIAAERDAYENGVLVDHRLDLMQPVAGGAVEDGKRIMQRLPTDWFERERLLWDAPRREMTVAVGGGELPASASFEDRRVSQGKEIKNRQNIVASINKSDGKIAVELAFADGKTKRCEAPVCRSEKLVALAWTPDGEALLLFERAGLAREYIWIWEPGATTARLVATTDGSERSSYRSPRCVAAREAIICSESGPLEPPRLVRINYANGRRLILADPNADLRHRIRASIEAFQPEPGLAALLLRPAGVRGPLPTVVQYYNCGGFLKGGVGDEIPMLPLVEHGIAVLCMDRRGDSARPTDKSAQSLGVADVEMMIDRLVAMKKVDPQRVGIGGLSFGSEVTLAAIRNSDLFAAATIASGQVTPIYYWANALPGRGFADMLHRYWKIGDPDADRARWKERLPTSDPAAISTPLLMQLPEAEARYMIEFHTKLKLAGSPAEMIVFADEPHIKNQPVHKRAVYERNLDWYRFWLKGEEDSDRAKRDQYARWRGYRSSQPSADPSRTFPGFGRPPAPRLDPGGAETSALPCSRCERTQRSMSAM